MNFIKFDKDKNAVIHPSYFMKQENIKIENCPKTLITCFSYNLVDYAVKNYNGKIVAYIGNTNGPIPIYEIEYNDKKYGFTMALVGSSSCIGNLEEAFCLGFENIVVFGSCGVLDNSIRENSIILPSSAIREEGTSFHYVEPSFEIETNVNTLNKMENFFKKYNFNYTFGKVWTTDAFYRETIGKVEYMKENGCNCVDMECSAIAAVAKFREKNVAQFFYAADNLDSDEYDLRSLGDHTFFDEKAKIVDIAINMASEIF